jgi:hypothetical protein
MRVSSSKATHVVGFRGGCKAKHARVRVWRALEVVSTPTTTLKSTRSLVTPSGLVCSSSPVKRNLGHYS